MGLLDGGIAAAFAGAFGSVYLAATLHRPTTTDDGMGGGSTSWTDEAVKVQPDLASQAMVSGDSYVESDGRMLMLASGQDDPSTDCELTFRGTRFSVVNWSADPARSYFDLHVRRKSDA
jgi:hypothetical protein